MEGNALSFPGLSHAGPRWCSTGIDKAMLSKPHPLFNHTLVQESVRTFLRAWIRAGPRVWSGLLFLRQALIDRGLDRFQIRNWRSV